MQTGDSKASKNSITSPRWGISSIVFLDGNLYIGGAIRRDSATSKFIPVIAKVDYDYTTFHWAFKRDDQTATW